jgi:hypothetical protein
MRAVARGFDDEVGDGRQRLGTRLRGERLRDPPDAFGEVAEDIDGGNGGFPWKEPGA